MSIALFHCLCFLGFLPSLLVVAQKTDTIILGSSLQAGDGSSPWLSPSGDFAFGFREAVNGTFLLAIWFNKIPEETITWSANRDQLAQTGSKLNLTLVGSLVLSDPNGHQMWSRIRNGVAFASLLDTGNFVLYNKSSAVIWQSFDEPTDTILPGQNLTQGKELIAPLSTANYSSGRFKIRMQDNGSLVFNTLNWPEDSVPYVAYDSFPTRAGGIGKQLFFNNQSGAVYIAAENGSAVAQVLPKQASREFLYQRAVLEFDGVFRRYVYPRSSSTRGTTKWTVQDFVPQDVCRQISRKNATRGGGACGYNSYCEIGDDQRPKCLCPPQGYTYLDEMDRMKGCKPDFDPHSCSEDAQESNQFQLVAINATNFVFGDYETLYNGTEDSCREDCLLDCLCAAVVFNSLSHCWKKRFPLSNGWRNDSFYQSTVTYIKIRTNGSLIGYHHDGANKVHKHRTLVIIESLLGGSGFLNVVFIIAAIYAASFCAHRYKARAGKHQDIPGANMRSFGYIELEEATNGFKEVIGQGAFATVYKGSLDSEEGDAIAVKKLNHLGKENQREFESEVRAIARTGHRNLVQLIGFCNEEQHRLLVYKYMPNGSLADILFQDPRPSWSQRIKFAFEIARGLNYLHEECSIQIIHCDIKPQNVLLDESLTVKISDFGLAKLLRKDQTQTITGIRGTKGYVAPEWFKSMPITTKVDVYSYGIMLLEIICCRRCFKADMEEESQMVLADWAYDCYKEGTVDKLVESDDEALTDIENVKKLVMVALWCIDDVPSARPSMKKVLYMIQEGVEETLPQDLATYSSCTNAHADDSPSSSTEALIDAQIQREENQANDPRRNSRASSSRSVLPCIGFCLGVSDEQVHNHDPL